MKIATSTTAVVVAAETVATAGAVVLSAAPTANGTDNYPIVQGFGHSRTAG